MYKIDRKKVFYIAFSPINGICNESFFEGSLTLYPNGEKGNIYYTTELVRDKNDENFLREYKKFIINEIDRITLLDKNVEFLMFNDKEKITKLCEDIKGIKIIKGYLEIK